jgi:hypothetical protein
MAKGTQSLAIAAPADFTESIRLSGPGGSISKMGGATEAAEGGRYAI